MKKVVLGFLLGLMLMPLAWAQAPEPPAPVTRSQLDQLFPTWNDPNAVVEGVIGDNVDDKFLMHYLPRLLELILIVVAPLVVVMFIYAGTRLVYAGGDEEDETASKKLIMYALMGTLFIVLSYTIMKAVFYTLEEDPDTVTWEADYEITRLQDNELQAPSPELRAGTLLYT